VLTFAFASTPVVREVTALGDLSYGTYLWAYVVQQVVIDRAPALPLAASVGLTIAITLPIAAVSWWFVERPALSLKGWRSISSTHENRRPHRVPLRP
jgi:peptidoglycan/LPS O-acetylase OafA/YrhL